MEVVAELIKQGANVDAATKVCATQESHKHTITHTGTLCMHEFTDTHTQGLLSLHLPKVTLIKQQERR